MFHGSLPAKFIEQAFSIIDFRLSSEVFVCCSGTFRFEHAIRAAYPDVLLFSNDVSLLSSAIGMLAAGQTLQFKFIDRLGFIEDLLQERPGEYIDRVAALIVAFGISQYHRNNQYCIQHFEHIRSQFYALIFTQNRS